MSIRNGALYTSENKNYGRGSGPEPLPEADQPAPLPDNGIQCGLQPFINRVCQSFTYFPVFGIVI